MFKTTKTSNGKNKRKSALTTFRMDYERHDTWSYAECGDCAGVSPYTVKMWLDEGKFPRTPVATPYCVIATPFKAFVKTGIPQVEAE